MLGRLQALSKTQQHGGARGFSSLSSSIFRTSSAIRSSSALTARARKPHIASIPKLKAPSPPWFPRLRRFGRTLKNPMRLWLYGINLRAKQDIIIPKERPEDTSHYADLRNSAFHRKIFQEKMGYLREALEQHTDEIYELAKPENMEKYFNDIAEKVFQSTQEYALQSREWKTRQIAAALDATNRLQKKGYDPWWRTSFDSVREYLQDIYNFSSNGSGEAFIENVRYSDEDDIDDAKARDLIFRMTVEKSQRELKIMRHASECRRLYRGRAPSEVLQMARKILADSMLEHERFVEQNVRQLEELARRQHLRTQFADELLRTEISHLRQQGKLAWDTDEAARHFMFPGPYFDPILQKQTLGPLPHGPSRMTTREMKDIVADALYGFSEYDAPRWRRYNEFRRRAYSWGILDRFPRRAFEEFEMPLMELNEKRASFIDAVKLKNEHKYGIIPPQDNTSTASSPSSEPAPTSTKAEQDSSELAEIEEQLPEGGPKMAYLPEWEHSIPFEDRLEQKDDPAPNKVIMHFYEHDKQFYRDMAKQFRDQAIKKGADPNKMSDLSFVDTLLSEISSGSFISSAGDRPSDSALSQDLTNDAAEIRKVTLVAIHQLFSQQLGHILAALPPDGRSQLLSNLNRLPPDISSALSAADCPLVCSPQKEGFLELMRNLPVAETRILALKLLSPEQRIDLLRSVPLMTRIQLFHLPWISRPDPNDVLLPAEALRLYEDICIRWNKSRGIIAIALNALSSDLFTAFTKKHELSSLGVSVSEFDGQVYPLTENMEMWNYLERKLVLREYHPQETAEFLNSLSQLDREHLMKQLDVNKFCVRMGTDGLVYPLLIPSELVDAVEYAQLIDSEEYRSWVATCFPTHQMQQILDALPPEKRNMSATFSPPEEDPKFLSPFELHEMQLLDRERRLDVMAVMTEVQRQQFLNSLDANERERLQRYRIPQPGDLSEANMRALVSLYSVAGLYDGKMPTFHEWEEHKRKFFAAARDIFTTLPEAIQYSPPELLHTLKLMMLRNENQLEKNAPSIYSALDSQMAALEDDFRTSMQNSADTNSASTEQSDITAVSSSTSAPSSTSTESNTKVTVSLQEADRESRLQLLSQFGLNQEDEVEDYEDVRLKFGASTPATTRIWDDYLAYDPRNKADRIEQLVNGKLVRIGMLPTILRQFEELDEEFRRGKEIRPNPLWKERGWIRQLFMDNLTPQWRKQLIHQLPASKRDELLADVRIPSDNEPGNPRFLLDIFVVMRARATGEPISPKELEALDKLYAEFPEVSNDVQQTQQQQPQQDAFSIPPPDPLLRLFHPQVDKEPFLANPPDRVETTYWEEEDNGEVTAVEAPLNLESESSKPFDVRDTVEWREYVTRKQPPLNPLYWPDPYGWWMYTIEKNLHRTDEELAQEGKKNPWALELHSRMETILMHPWESFSPSLKRELRYLKPQAEKFRKSLEKREKRFAQFKEEEEALMNPKKAAGSESVNATANAPDNAKKNDPAASGNDSDTTTKQPDDPQKKTASAQGETDVKNEAATETVKEEEEEEKENRMDPYIEETYERLRNFDVYHPPNVRDAVPYPEHMYIWRNTLYKYTNFENIDTSELRPDEKRMLKARLAYFNTYEWYLNPMRKFIMFHDVFSGICAPPWGTEVKEDPKQMPMNRWIGWKLHNFFAKHHHMLRGVELLLMWYRYLIAGLLVYVFVHVFDFLFDRYLADGKSARFRALLRNDLIWAWQWLLPSFFHYPYESFKFDQPRRWDFLLPPPGEHLDAVDLMTHLEEQAAESNFEPVDEDDMPGDDEVEFPLSTLPYNADANVVDRFSKFVRSTVAAAGGDEKAKADGEELIELYKRLGRGPNDEPVDYDQPVPDFTDPEAKKQLFAMIDDELEYDDNKPERSVFEDENEDDEEDQDNDDEIRPENPEDLDPKVDVPLRENYTLVIPFERLLGDIHPTVQGHAITLRPNFAPFMDQIFQHFDEVIIWSENSCMPMWTFFEHANVTAYPFQYFYKEQLTVTKDHRLIKDIRKLGRPLNNIIWVDVNPDAFALQPEHCLYVSPQHQFIGKRDLGRADDHFLRDLVPGLLLIRNYMLANPQQRRGFTDIRNVLEELGPDTEALFERMKSSPLYEYWRQDFPDRPDELEEVRQIYLREIGANSWRRNTAQEKERAKVFWRHPAKDADALRRIFWPPGPLPEPKW